MTLQDYLKENGITEASFAKTIGKTRQAVWYWLKGSKYPSRTSMIKIEEVTGGAVKPLDWFA